MCKHIYSLFLHPLSRTKAVFRLNHTLLNPFWCCLVWPLACPFTSGSTPDSHKNVMAVITQGAFLAVWSTFLYCFVSFSTILCPALSSRRLTFIHPACLAISGEMPVAPKVEKGFNLEHKICGFSPTVQQHGSVLNWDNWNVAGARLKIKADVFKHAKDVLFGLMFGLYDNTLHLLCMKLVIKAS